MSVYTLIVKNSDKTESREYELEDLTTLYRKNDTYDTFNVDSEGNATVTRRIGIDTTTGESYILPNPITTAYGTLSIELYEGKNYIELLDDSNTVLSVAYILKNEFTNTYATKVELHSSIEQSADNILLQVSRQYPEKDKIISAINLSPEEIAISSNKINLNGAVTANNNFKILRDGSMQAKNGTFTGGQIQLNGGTEQEPNLIVGGYDETTGAFDASLLLDYGLVTYYDNHTDPQNKINNSANVQANENQASVSLSSKKSWGSIHTYPEWGSFYMETIPSNGTDWSGNLLKTETGTNQNYSYLMLNETQANKTNRIRFLVNQESNDNGSNWISIDKNDNVFALDVYKNKIQAAIRYDKDNTNNRISTTVDSGGAGLHLIANGSTTDIYAVGIYTPQVTQTSREEDKKNFEKLNQDEALKIILDTDIYKYNLNFEDDKDKKHLGFVIGKKYKHSKEITAEQEGKEIGVDNYSMISATYGAIQKLNEIIENQQKQIDELKEQIKLLKEEK